MHRVRASVALLLACLVLPGHGRATTLNELKVGVRILDFTAAPMRGRVPVAILYDGGVKASLEDAQAIEGWLAGGIAPAGIQPAATLVDLRQSGHDFPFHVAIVAAGAAAYFDLIQSLAVQNHTLVISADLDCVRQGKCTVGVSSAPRVEVVVNRAAAMSCSVEFTEAFRMMVREY